MEIPFDIEEIQEVGNIMLCPKHSTATHNVYLKNRQVAEKLGLKSGVEMYKHQILASRYLFHQDSLLLIHEPGTGKTETAQYAMLLLFVAGLINKIYIINKSENFNVKANKTFKNLWNIKRFSHLTLDEFIDKHVIYDTYSLVGKRYDMVSPFDYSGIIFDEAHELVSESSDTKKNTDAIRLVEVLSRAKGCKVILSSATPIINDASSFNVIQRILLRSPSIESSFVLPGELVSYKRATYDHLNIIQMKNETDPFQGNPYTDGTVSSYPMKVYRVRPYRCQMADIVEHLVETERQNFGVVYDALSICSASREIDISQYGIPCEKEATPSSVPRATSSNTLQEDASTEVASSTATSYTGNRQVIDSCFLDEIVRNIRLSKDGIVVVYMSLKKEGSQAISSLLQKHGFEPYTGIPQEKPTFLVYESGSQNKQRKLFEDAKKPENWNGSIVKVIIGSKVMRDGVDIHHVVQTHIAQPEWHISGLIQAWHRGIRSNGHNWLIYHRALELMKEDTSLTLDEAKKRITIDYQIFNYVIEINNLTDEEINASRSLFRFESNKRLSNEEIKKRVEQRNPSLRKVEIALRKYGEVGSIMETLRRSSIDYTLNGGEGNVTSAKLSTTSNYFFTSDISGLIIQSATRLITEKFHLNVSQLIRNVMEKYPFTNERSIISSLIHMWRNKYLLYVPKYGIEMSLKFNKDELILTSNASNGTLCSFSDTYNICVSKELSFHPPPLEAGDLQITSCRTITMVNKLKQALIDVLRGTTNSNLTYSFLRYMTNFWGFPESNLDSDTPMDVNLYIFSRHVSKCSIHVKQKVKGVLTVNADNFSFTMDKQWIQAKSKDIRLIRPIEPLERYDSFDFSTIPELSQVIDMTTYQTKTNGMVMLKCFARNIPFVSEPNVNLKDFTRTYLTSIINFDTLTDTKLISVKEFSNERSKGRQLELLNEGETIQDKLVEELSKGVYLIFFPYEENTDDTEGNVLEKLIKLKKRELSDINNSVSGNDALLSWKYRIPVLEYLEVSGRITSQRKSDIYTALWSGRNRL